MTYGLSETKKFNGKIFKLSHLNFSKEDAIKSAEGLHKSGNLTRIVPISKSEREKQGTHPWKYGTYYRRK